MPNTGNQAKQLQDRINELTVSEESLRTTLAAMVREIERLHTRINQLESDLMRLLSSLPMTDGEMGRSTETTAGGFERPD